MLQKVLDREKVTNFLDEKRGMVRNSRLASLVDVGMYTLPQLQQQPPITQQRVDNRSKEILDDWYQRMIQVPNV